MKANGTGSVDDTRPSETARCVVGIAMATTLILPLIVPMIGWSQEPKGPLVAVLMTLAYPARLEAFRSGLAGLGYEEGRTITVVSRKGADDGLDALAAELVRLKPAVLVGDTAPTTRALFRATKSIPIVFMATADPVGAGFVRSLGHPGGNVTGLSEMTAELTGKRCSCYWRSGQASRPSRFSVTPTTPSIGAWSRTPTMPPSRSASASSTSPSAVERISNAHSE